MKKTKKITKTQENLTFFTFFFWKFWTQKNCFYSLFMLDNDDNLQVFPIILDDNKRLIFFIDFLGQFCLSKIWLTAIFEDKILRIFTWINAKYKNLRISQRFWLLFHVGNQKWRLRRLYFCCSTFFSLTHTKNKYKKYNKMKNYRRKT